MKSKLGYKHVFIITRIINGLSAGVLVGWFIYIIPQAFQININSSAETRIALQSIAVIGLFFLSLAASIEWRETRLSAAIDAYRCGEEPEAHVQVFTGLLVRIFPASSGMYLLSIRKRGRRVFAHKLRIPVAEIGDLFEIIQVEKHLKVKMQQGIEEELRAALFSYFVRKTKGEMNEPITVRVEFIGNRIVKIEKTE